MIFIQNISYSGKLIVLLLFILAGVNSSCNKCKKKQQSVNEDYPIWGIDISHHQSKIDWDLLCRQKPAFIFFKATEGSTHTDTKYLEYSRKARENAIIPGAYHFFSYQSSGHAQAKHFLSVAELKKGDMPPVLDAEFRRDMPPKAKVTKELLSFLNTIESYTGTKPIIYCECDYYNKYLKNNLKGEYYLWISDFWGTPKCKWLFWQKTDKYKIDGIKGTVDYNVFNGDSSRFNDILIK